MGKKEIVTGLCWIGYSLLLLFLWEVVKHKINIVIFIYILLPLSVVTTIIYFKILRKLKEKKEKDKINKRNWLKISTGYKIKNNKALKAIEKMNTNEIEYILQLNWYVSNVVLRFLEFRKLEARDRNKAIKDILDGIEATKRLLSFHIPKISLIQLRITYFETKNSNFANIQDFESDASAMISKILCSTNTLNIDNVKEIVELSKWDLLSVPMIDNRVYFKEELDTNSDHIFNELVEDFGIDSDSRAAITFTINELNIGSESTSVHYGHIVIFAQSLNGINRKHVELYCELLKDIFKPLLKGLFYSQKLSLKDLHDD